MSHLNAYDAHPSVAEEAKHGEHAGWSTFDTKLEGARFHLIHAAVAIDPFDPATAGRLLDELDALAQSYGYGVTDSYLADTAGLSDEDIDGNVELSIQRDNLFEEIGEEDPYFAEVRSSERKLLAAAATAEARQFLGAAGQPESWDGAWGPIYRRMEEAFVRGRDMRAAQTFDAPKP